MHNIQVTSLSKKQTRKSDIPPRNKAANSQKQTVGYVAVYSNIQVIALEVQKKKTRVISLSCPNANCYANQSPSVIGTANGPNDSRRIQYPMSCGVPGLGGLLLLRLAPVLPDFWSSWIGLVKENTHNGQIDIPLTHVGHRRCDRFGSPQPEHVLISMASFKALPAICL